MDLDLTKEDKEFAERLGRWLSENVEPGWRDNSRTYEDYIQTQVEWEARLTAGGWAGIWWPLEYGGMGTTPTQRAIYAEMTARAGAPEGIGRTGRRLLGPAVMRYGTDKQKAEILPRILDGSETWCQGYSEPNAGSDLASVTTRAVRDGDNYIVNGSKIWTSHGQFVDRCFIIVRTDPTAEKHAGLSILLADLRAPGVDIRPIIQIDGHAEFCEVFYTDVVIPSENILGTEGGGWEIAKYILRYERGAVMVFDTLIRIERHLAQFVENAPDSQIGQLALGRGAAEVEAARLLAYRVLSEQLRGGDPTDAGSITKLYWSQAWVRLAESALLTVGEGVYNSAPGSSGEGLLDNFLACRPGTIASGSSEIQRNIVAKRVLGLPTA